jgi:hypothetical protein
VTTFLKKQADVKTLQGKPLKFTLQQGAGAKAVQSSLF